MMVDLGFKKKKKSLCFTKHKKFLDIFIYFFTLFDFYLSCTYFFVFIYFLLIS